MKKITLFFFLLNSSICSAQYFIPLFNITTDTMASCNLLIADTTDNYLYIMSRDSSLDQAYSFAYRNDTIQFISSTTSSGEYYKTGCSTDSGIVTLCNGDNELYTIDSLLFQNCTYNFCNVMAANTMVSRNDTIYKDGNTGGHDYVIGLCPNGTSFTIGDATGGSGISDLEFFNGYLYASGSFTDMNGNPACKYICWWDGVNWNPVNQTGVDSINGFQIVSLNGYGSMEVLNNNLILYGGVTLQSSNNNLLVKCDLNNCTAVSGLYNSVAGGLYADLINYSSKIYLLGALKDSASNFVGLCNYDGSKIKFYYGIDFFNPSTSSVYKDTLFIGGSFDHISYVPAKNIAKFVDNSFSSFAPVTTKWWYNSSDTAYKYYEVARDTFIMHTANYYGYNCRKIIGKQHEHDSTVTPLQPLYVFGDTSRVMYYNSYRGRFVPLYNFNVNTGDTLTYYTPQPQTAADTTFRVVVDSITQLNVQGINCKRVWSFPLDNWSFGNDGYVQLVGGMGSMLPQPINYYNTEGPLRCYEDTSVFYHYLVTVNCEQLDTTTGISEQLSVNSYQLTVSSLNENSIAVNILISRGTQAELLIYNMQGQLIATKNISLRAGENHFTEPTPYAQGMYLLQVRTKSEVRNVKFVLQ